MNLKIQNSEIDAVIDDQDLDMVRGHGWTLVNGRIGCLVDGQFVLIEQALLGDRDGKVAQHKDGNPLNCRRANLVVHQGGKLKGVTPMAGRWKAQVKVGGKVVALGAAHTAEEAHAIYVEKAERVRRERAGKAKDPVLPKGVVRAGEMYVAVGQVDGRRVALDQDEDLGRLMARMGAGDR